MVSKSTGWDVPLILVADTVLELRIWHHSSWNTFLLFLPTAASGISPQHRQIISAWRQPLRLAGHKKIALTLVDDNLLSHRCPQKPGWLSSEQIIKLWIWQAGPADRCKVCREREMCPQVMAPGGSRSGCSQSPAACYLLCQPPAGVQQASYTILHVLTWSSVRGGLSGTPPPQISSASETMWFSQVCGPFSGGRAFMFSKDKLSLVRTGGEDRDSGQNRCFRGRHQQLV